MLLKTMFSNLFFSQYKVCNLRFYIVPGHNDPSLLYGNCLPCIIIFRRRIRSQMQRMGKGSVVTLGRFFHQQESVGQLLPPGAANESSWEKKAAKHSTADRTVAQVFGVFLGSVEHLKINFKVFCLVQKLNSVFFSFKRNMLFGSIISC